MGYRNLIKTRKNDRPLSKAITISRHVRCSLVTLPFFLSFASSLICIADSIFVSIQPTEEWRGEESATILLNLFRKQVKHARKPGRKQRKKQEARKDARKQGNKKEWKETRSSKEAGKQERRQERKKGNKEVRKGARKQESKKGCKETRREQGSKEARKQERRQERKQGNKEVGKGARKRGRKQESKKGCKETRREQGSKEARKQERRQERKQGNKEVRKGARKQGRKQGIKKARKDPRKQGGNKEARKQGKLWVFEFRRTFCRQKVIMSTMTEGTANFKGPDMCPVAKDLPVARSTNKNGMMRGLDPSISACTFLLHAACHAQISRVLQFPEDNLADRSHHPDAVAEDACAVCE